MSKKTVVLAEDSWMAGYVDGQGDTGVLADALSVRAECRLAVSGSTAVDWALDKDQMLTRLLECAKECQCVVLSLGGNGALRAMKNDGKITPEELCEVASAISAVTEGLKEHFREVFLVLYANPYPDDSAAAVGCALLNALLIASAAHETIFIPSYSVLNREAMSGAGIHPSQAGYVKLASLIERIVGGLNE